MLKAHGGFHTLYEVVGECWIWKGSMFGSGYGSINIEGRHFSAHRISYIFHKGPIPVRHVIRHTCDNPLCVNPAHLIVGTDLQNKQDAVDKGRHAFGSKHGRAKLDEEKVREIKKLFLTGATTWEIARIYGVDASTITNIRRGRNWTHVTLE